MTGLISPPYRSLDNVATCRALAEAVVHLQDILQIVRNGWLATCIRTSRAAGWRLTTRRNGD